MIQIGITGGIGSGKTTVCKLLEYFEIPVFYADEEAKKLLHRPDIIVRLQNYFGDELLSKTGEIDRKKLSEWVFSASEKLSYLNSIIHPEVAKIYKEWLLKNNDKMLVAKEAAILFESKNNLGLDKIITVYAPLELRIKRTMQRSNMSRAEVLGRIKNQLSEEEKIKNSDFVIYNDEQKNIVPQLLSIFEKLAYSKTI
jgi:dephospho-CoA kinase